MEEDSKATASGAAASTVVSDTANQSARMPSRFWILLGAAGASNLADGIFKMVVPLVAVTLTRDPMRVAGVSVAASLPWLLCSLPVGVLVDRLDRRVVMLVANVVRSLITAIIVLCGTIGFLNIWVLYVCGVAIGIAEVCYDTSSQSILPQIVATAQLQRANGHLYAAEVTLNNFVGSPLGGLLMGLGVALSFGVPAALWLLAAGGLLCIRGRFRVVRTAPPQRMFSEIAEGLRFLMHHRVLRTLAVFTGVANMGNAAASAVFVLFAVGIQSPMKLTDSQYGLLLSAGAVGSLIGAVLSDQLINWLGRSRALIFLTFFVAALIGVPALTSNVWVIGGIYVVAGCGISVWNVIVVSLRQAIVPPSLLGRLNSAYRLLAWGMIPVGSAIGGILAKMLGLRPLFAVMALLVLLPLVLLREISEDRLRAAVVEAEIEKTA